MFIITLCMDGGLPHHLLYEHSNPSHLFFVSTPFSIFVSPLSLCKANTFCPRTAVLSGFLFS